jgi:glycerol-3-phosphate dehydrogenase (NAD(P)+)
METITNKVSVLGAGSWGTALAEQLARHGQRVMLWGVEEGVVADVNNLHRNSKYFPTHVLQDNIIANTQLAEVIVGSKLVVFAVPSHAIREVAKKVKPYLATDAIIVSAAKGLERATLLRMSEVLKAELGNPQRILVLSGPSFALEVLKGLPTALTLAGEDEGILQNAVKSFHSENFRVYTTHDLTGVELGGAIKNVIALAAGILDGAEIGTNGRAALVTRGLAEMQRIIHAAGGDRLTAVGLSGLGDLLLTTTGELSRNRRVGIMLAKGKRLPEILSELGQVAEGVETAPKIVELAKKYKIAMPISEAVNEILQEKLTVSEAIKQLLTRAQKREVERS